MKLSKLCDLFFSLAFHKTCATLGVGLFDKAKIEQEKLLNTRNTLESAQQKAQKSGWKIVEKQTKSLSTTEVFNAVKSAVSSYLGISDNVDQVAQILMGQLSIETGGLRVAHNYNVGNIMAHGSTNQFWHGDVIVLHAHEYDKNKTKYWLYSLFRAYNNLVDGVSDWMTFLKAKFPGALEKAKTGDVDGFVVALKQGGYFTAPVEEYMKGVKSGIKSMQAKIEKERRMNDKSTMATQVS
jgi:flagellum-specific peptidoglycan hydrolase FlgJ